MKWVFSLAIIWFIIWHKWNISAIMVPKKSWENTNFETLKLRKSWLRVGICEYPGIFVALRFMSGEIQKLTLELSRHLGALFISITIIYNYRIYNYLVYFPREADKYCHTARELKHRVKHFDQSHSGKLWKSKVQNLISWESLHWSIRPFVLVEPTAQQLISDSAFHFSNRKLPFWALFEMGLKRMCLFLSDDWIISILRTWADFDLQGKKSTVEETSQVRGLQIAVWQMWTKGSMGLLVWLPHILVRICFCIV